jgi:LacI family transcriptional regulator
LTLLKDVADHAGVSTATISRVLNGTGFVSDALRERVLAAVEDLNYTPNGVARSMAQSRTLTLALVVPDITNPFFTAVARGAEDAAQESGYSLIFCNTDQSPEKEQLYLRVLREKRVDGVLLAVSGREVHHIQRLVAAGMKIVLIDRDVPELNLPSVCVDNQGAVETATRYLIDRGHSRIGFMTGNLEVASAQERLDGYLAALAHAGIARDPALIVSGNFTQHGGHQAGLSLYRLPAPPTAIVSSNNEMTTGLLIALRECGRSVPYDVSLISFDDLPYFSLLEHPLTVVAQPMYEVGRRACQLLLHVLTEGTPASVASAVRLPVEFIARESCRSI